jgi:hypothetical protein
MIGRAWRSGRRMRLFYGVCVCIYMYVGAVLFALLQPSLFWLPVEMRVRGERECLSFHNGSLPHG